MTQSIVLQVCAEREIDPVEFFGPRRNARLVKARRIAIERFKEAGFTMAGTARMMRRNCTTIRYWLRPKERKRHNDYARAYHTQRRMDVAHQNS